MSLALHYWMGGVHHCSGPPSPKWPTLCRVGRYTPVYCTILRPWTPRGLQSSTPTLLWSPGNP